jgi:pimeloyl-ACP methyl ester carboxylesterase
MPFAFTNGVHLAYERAGQGEPVLLIMGSGTGGSAWSLYQVPALHRARYETIRFDYRGIPPSDAPAGPYSVADLVADTTGLIEALDAGPCRLVGTSLGAVVAAQLAASRPDLVSSCVLMALKGRADAARQALWAADRARYDAAVRLPPAYDALASALQMFSPATLNDDNAMSAWLGLFEISSGRKLASGHDGLDLSQDRRALLRTIKAPCRVIAFADDLLCPPHLCAEAADAIPDCDFAEIASCGHLGYLERPREVNRAIIEFLDMH